MTSGIEHHVLALVGAAVGETIRIDELFDGDDRVLRYRWPNSQLEECVGDVFEALGMVRRRIERESLVPFCWGASLDVYPSGMSRNMSAGLRAYQLRMGELARTADLLRSFDAGRRRDRSFPIEAQERRWRAWLASVARADGPI